MGKIALKTTGRDDYETPQELFEELNHKFRFKLDPASSDENHKCIFYYTKAMDGLSKDWHEYDRVWLNPPYGRHLQDWVQKAYSESQKGCTVVCLLPARTDTAWFHDYCLKYGEIRWIRGRLNFGGNHNAPFPSMIVIFRNKL